MAKEYTVIVTTYSNSSRSSDHRTTEYTGTMEYLTSKIFGYTLDCGHSWNSKIPLKPKTGKSLVKALNDSANECRDYRNYYELKEG